jgi:hypothetical protein
MNDQLTQAERIFLQKHGIALTDVYDARGQSMEAWRKRAKDEDKRFIVGTACAKGGHRLRTRSGHCIQCNPANITFQKRHGKAGCVYIAGSLKLRLIKVGGSTSLAFREDRLSEESYGGADDWRLLKRERAPEYGKLEQRVHALLKPWAVEASYAKGAHAQHAREVYACGFSQAARALEQAMKDLSLSPDPLGIAPFAAQYEFLVEGP